MTKLFALYIKFRYSTIDTIQKWDHILSSIDYNKADVYIWMFEGEKKNIFLEYKIITLMNKYNKAIFVTNYNEGNYLTEEDSTFLKTFMNKSLISDNQKCIGESHLKAFLIPKNVEYIFKLDGDDMFYPTLKESHLYACIDKMKEADLNILTRPFWAWCNHGWSFGFTIAKKNILDILKINDLNIHYNEGMNKLRDTVFTDVSKVTNVDNLFGYILFTQNASVSNSFFYITDCKWENNKENEFIDHHNCIKV
jgi:hypothetical protein